jgi:hypothetical protein
MRDFLKYRVSPVLVFVAINALAIYCLVTGRMFGKTGNGSFLVEGRHSGPTLYWIYMFFLLVGTATLDIFIARTILKDNARSIGPNQSKDPTA